MSFAGLPKAQDRADVIAYLESSEIGRAVAGDRDRGAAIDLDPFWRSRPTSPMPPARRSARISAQPIAVDDKPDLSPVTIADREAEAAMRRLIAARFPDHGIIGEEFGREREDAEFVWVLDPIDGTKSFIIGRAAVRHADRAGPSRAPDARHHRPADLARALGRRRRPADTVQRRAGPLSGPAPALAAATLFATSPDMFAGADDAGVRAGVAAAAKLVRFGADCYAYGLLALGFVDLVIEASLKPYDFSAMLPIVEGAGGVASDWQRREAERRIGRPRRGRRRPARARGGAAIVDGIKSDSGQEAQCAGL